MKGKRGEKRKSKVINIITHEKREGFSFVLVAYFFLIFNSPIVYSLLSNCHMYVFLKLKYGIGPCKIGQF